MLIQTSGHRMLHMFSGLLALLDLAIIWGQIAEGTSITSEVLIENGKTKFDNGSYISGQNGTFFFKEKVNGSTIYEEQENFQDQEQIHLFSECVDESLMSTINKYCLEDFNSSMSNLGEENWCDWEMVVRHYHVLTHCMEQCATFAHCYYPNAVVQETFVKVHKQYFSLCATKEDALPDAPASVVLVLTLLPVSVIPVLVYMVIRKSSVID